MAHRLDDYQNDINSQRQSAWDARELKDEGRECVALRRIVSDDDRRETLALNFGRAFSATSRQAIPVLREDDLERLALTCSAAFVADIEDEDGVDGPFESAMDAAIRQDGAQ